LKIHGGKCHIRTGPFVLYVYMSFITIKFANTDHLQRSVLDIFTIEVEGLT